MTVVIEDVWTFITALPSAVGAPLVLFAGWLIAKLLRVLVPKILSALKFDRLNEKLHVTEFLRKGHVKQSPSLLVGIALYWMIMLIVLAMAASVLDERAAASISGWLFGSVPIILAAAITASIGIIVVNFLSNFVDTIARNAAIASALLIRRGIRAVGYLVVLVMVVEQLGLGQSIVSTLLLISFGSIALGAAIALGLGCKDLARRYVESFIRSLQERERAAHGTDLEG